MRRFEWEKTPSGWVRHEVQLTPEEIVAHNARRNPPISGQGNDMGEDPDISALESRRAAFNRQSQLLAARHQAQETLRALKESLKDKIK